MDTQSQIDGLKASLEKAKTIIQQQQEELNKLATPPLYFGTVIQILDKSVILMADNKMIEVALPKEKVEPGDVVTVHPMSQQIVAKKKIEVAGVMGFVKQVIDTIFSEVELDGGTKVVFNGKFADKVDKGDKVILDSSLTILLKNYGKQDKRYQLREKQTITWNDIGGLREAKQQMIEAIESPHKNKDVFAYYKKKLIKGILLWGPPGAGKTMVAKAAATSMAKIYSGKHYSEGFIYVKGPEILDKYVGVAEGNVRSLFVQAREFKRENGYPAVLFIDEADAIFSKRGSGISTDIMNTIVPSMLTEMDGLEDSGALVILATNRPDILDPAIVRDGRIDRKIKITRPDEESSEEIFEIYLRDKPIREGDTKKSLSITGRKELFSHKRLIYNIHIKQETKPFRLSHIISGAMIANIVEQATSFAICRDMKSGKTTGLNGEDMVKAIDQTYRQNFDTNHNDALSEFVEPFRDQVERVEKVFS